MRRPTGGAATPRDESCGAKWSELRGYERALSEGGPEPEQGRRIPAESPRLLSALTTKQRLIEFRKESGRRLVNMKNQLAGKYRRTDEEDTRSEVSSSPSGNSDPDSRVSGGVSLGSIKSIGAVGRGIKSSKSLQNLEQITKDSWRQVADKTTYLGQNFKHKYSSKMDINKLAPKMHYEELGDPGDYSDEENRPSDQLF